MALAAEHLGISGSWPTLVFWGQWSDRWWPLSKSPRTEVSDRATGLPVQPIVVRNARGRIIGPQETRASLGKGDSKVLQDMEAFLAKRSEK